MSKNNRKKIGLVGYGKISQYLLSEWVKDPFFNAVCEIDFVWNRSEIDQSRLPVGVRKLKNLEEFSKSSVDLIVELAHPDVIKEWGHRFLAHSSLLIGSPTVFCDRSFENSLICAAEQSTNALFCAKGALMGLEDLLSLAKQGDLESLRISMKKAPDSIRYNGPLSYTKKPYNPDEISEETRLYAGSVRELASFAPNNVNTMVVAALASNLGLDATYAELIAAPGIDYHAVDWHAECKAQNNEPPFRIDMSKRNPALKGAVTGKRTFMSFKESVLSAANCSSQGGGKLQFC